MVCCQLLFRWIRSDILESKKKREEGRSITMKQYYGSLSDRLLSAWACFELILLAFFLYKKQGSGFPNNFLHDLCTIATCPNVLNRMIATKVITAMLLFLGAKWVWILDFYCSSWGNRTIFIGKMCNFFRLFCIGITHIKVTMVSGKYHRFFAVLGNLIVLY